METYTKLLEIHFHRSISVQLIKKHLDLQVFINVFIDSSEVDDDFFKIDSTIVLLVDSLK